MNRKSILAALAVLAAPVVAPAAVTVKGSDTMVILSQRWAEAYMQKSAGKQVQVTGGGSGTGIAALINGTTDIANASRAMKKDEQAKVKQKYRSEPVETTVAKDGVAFYVHESNPVKSLTVEQLRDIYLGDVDNWKQVGGPDQKIVVYSRENSSGTYVFVKEEVLKNADFTPRAQTLPGTAAVVNAVSKERWGIGFGGGAYAKGVRELLVNGVAPTLKSVQSGEYALARPLFMYTRAAPSGDVKAFIDFCLSPEGQEIVSKVGYFPLK